MEKATKKTALIVTIGFLTAIIVITSGFLATTILLKKNNSKNTLYEPANSSLISKTQNSCEKNNSSTQEPSSSTNNSNSSTTKNKSGKNSSKVDSNSKTSITSSNTKDISQYNPPEKVTKIFSFKNNFQMSKVKKQIFNDQQNGNSLPYCLFLPENYEKSKQYPVILFLHGAGETGSDNEKQLKNLTNLFKYNGDLISTSILICPQTTGWWDLDRAYAGDQGGSLGSALHLLEEIKSTYSCDSKRIYVMGLSMGGYATWDLLEKHGDIFAAGIPICGGGNSNNGAAYIDIPIRIFHGTNDATVSFNSSKSMYNSIINAGGKKIKFIKLEGVGHNAWDTAFSDRDTFSWLFAQNKMSNPTGEYDYIPYFKIVNSTGKIVISNEDISDITYYQDFNKKSKITIDLYLTENGKNKLTNAYTTSGGKQFTVYWSTQKLYTFTATQPPKNSIFKIIDIFDNSNILEFYNMLYKFKA
ncbi:MAG: hypothetical protein E7537_01595 [Ruminococcaceae bacterium]|nr:hypothetical protein [Oscillospiraceae bacterium]